MKKVILQVRSLQNNRILRFSKENHLFREILFDSKGILQIKTKLSYLENLSSLY